MTTEPANPRLLRWSKRLHVQRYTRLAVRVVHMSPLEIVYRVRLAIRKRTRAMPAAGNIDRWDNGDAFIAALGSDPSTTLSKCLDAGFFFGPSQRAQLSAILSEHMPAVARRTIALADALLDDGIDILGVRVGLKAGKLDWHADPRTGRRFWPPDTPITEYEAIDTRGADVKHVWEVNRHQFLLLLCRAFWLTGEASYAQRAAFLIEDWIDTNPVGRGVNWCSHLEVAVRAISWLWALPHLLSLPDLETRFLEKWLRSLAAHHRHLAGNLSIYTDPTNHLIGETSALWMLSVCLPQLPDAARLASRAQQILEREIARQVAADGVNVEQATSYHRFVLDFYVQFVILAKRNERRLSAIVEQRVRAMFDFAAALAGVRGDAPMIGDSDDGRGLPISNTPNWDFRDLLCVGAVLFREPSFKAANDGATDLMVWLLGAHAIETYVALDNAPPLVSSVFREGGYCFLHAATTEQQRLEMIFDCGPLGLLPNAAHGHADALSIQLRIDGVSILVDPGTGTYFENAQVRDALRSTRAHNTLSVDGLDQADLFDTFKWVNPMQARLLEAHTGADFDYVHAVHDGYCRLTKPVRHFRSVLFIKPWGWIVVDRVTGTGKHTLRRHFNFPHSVALSEETRSRLTAIDAASGYGVSLELPQLDLEFDYELKYDHGGLWSDRYGHWQSAPHLDLVCLREVPAVLITFITPVFAREKFVKAVGAKYSLEYLDAGGVLCSRALDTDDETDLLLVNPSGANTALPGGGHTDAHMLFVRRAADGQVQRAWVTGGAVKGTDLALKPRDGETCASFMRRTEQPVSAASGN